MNKRIALLFATIFLGLMLCAHAAAETCGDWVYRVDEEGHARITAYASSAAASADIPVTLDGLYVTGVDTGAFCANIGSVTVPGTVVHLEPDAFAPSTRLRARNGSAALSYAAEYGLACENLSTFEFTPAVVDFTGIDSTEYSYLSSGVRMRRAWAAQLQAGSLFFLPPDQRNAMGDGYVVRSMTTDGEWVNIAMAEADPTLILERISVRVENLKPDYANIEILDEGVSDLQVIANRGTFEIGNISDSVSFTFKDSWHESQIELGVSLDELVIDMDLMPYELYDFHYTSGIQANLSTTALVSSPKDAYKKDILNIPFVRYGIVTARAIISYNCDFKGQVSISASFTCTETVSYSPENGWAASITPDVSASISGSAEITPELSMPTLAISLPIVENIAELSLKLGLPLKVEAAYDPEHFSTNLCVNASIGPEVWVEAWVGLTIETERLNLDRRIKWSSEKLPLAKWEWHMEDGVKVDRCTKESRKLCFDTGFDLQLAPVYGAADDFPVEIPPSYYTILRPGYTLRGWYYYPADSVSNVKIETPAITLLEPVTTVYALWDPEETEDTDYGVSLDPDTPPEVDTTESSYDYNQFRINTYHMSHAVFPSFEEYCSHFTHPTEPDKYAQWLSGMNESYRSLTLTSFGNACNPTITSRVWDEGYISADSLAYNTSLVSVQFPSTMKTVGSFEGCSSLKAVDLSFMTLTAIDPGFFQSCTSLESVILPASVASIGASAFADTPALKAISLSGTSVGANAFSGSGIEDIVIPQTMTGIAQAFVDADKLKTVTILSTPEQSDEAFMDCDKLESVSIHAPSATLGRNMFQGCESLVRLDAQDTVLRIESGCFENCTSLEAVDVCASRVENGAFRNAYSLQTVRITGDDVYIDEQAFANTPIVSLTIECTGDLYIHPYAFSGCSQLAEVSIHAGTGTARFDTLPGLIRASFSADTSIGVDLFCCRALKELSVTAPDITMLNTYECPKLTTLMVQGQVGKNAGRIDAPGFEELKLHMNGEDFNLCISSEYLKRVEITGSVGSIGASAFKGCTNLREVVLPAISGSIGENAFYYCKKLESFTLPAMNGAIGKAAFANCAFTEFTVPDGTTAIEAEAFKFCSALETLTVPDSVSEIFGGFDITYYDSATWTYGAFYSCSNLKWINCTEGGPIDQLAFSTGIAAGSRENTKLYSLHLQSRVDADPSLIQAEAGQSVALPVIRLAFSNPYIFSGWFADEACTQAVSSPYLMPDHDVTLYGGLTLRNAAPNASSLVVEGETLVSYDYPGTLFVPEGITTILSGAIGGSVEDVHLPASVSVIQPGAFAQAGSLRGIWVDGGNSSFYASGSALYAAGGTLVTCPAQVGETLTIHEGATAIGADAFNWPNGSNRFHSLFIPDSVLSVADGAFDRLDPTTKAYGPIDGPVADAAMNAGLRYNRYLVAFMSGEDFVGAVETTAGWLLPEVAQPSREGMTFAGWSLENGGEPLDLTTYTTPREDIAVYEVWEEGGTQEPTEFTWTYLPQNLREIESYAFLRAPIQAVRCPDGLETIRNYAFDFCSSMEIIVIPSMNTAVEPYAFHGCSHENFVICAPEGSLAHQFTQMTGFAWLPLE